MIVVLIVAGVLLVLTILFTLWLPSFIMTGKRQTIEEAMKWQSEHYDVSFYDQLEKSEYVVEGHEGYVLHAELLKNPTPSAKYVILSHGYTDNRMGSLKYVPTYMKLGFNCIIYDLRGHGENEATFTSYGVREAQDLNLLIHDTWTRYPEIMQLGLHGESLGAATTITALKFHPEVDFVVADCGFSDIENVLRGGFKSAHLPGFIMELADLGAKIRYHYSLKAMRPIDSLDENEVPILFMHGAADKFILPKNSEDMAKRTKGKSEVHLIPGAEHAMSILTDPELYEKCLETFLKRLD